MKSLQNGIYFYYSVELSLSYILTEKTKGKQWYDMAPIWASRVAKHHIVGLLKNRNMISHRSGGQKSNIKMSSCLVSFEASLLVLWWPLSLCILTWLFFYVHVPLVFICCPNFLILEGHQYIGLRPSLMA
jgi:hypothetical protein